jgi:two-component sensor histidine kinase
MTKDIEWINITTYTENLIRYLFQVYRTATDIRYKTDIEEVMIPLKTAIPCGLVMSEIVTNALKYAFPQTFSSREIRGEPCTITLSLKREGNDYLLKITDNGIGIPEGIDITAPRTLGLFLIRLIVKHQLRGTLETSTAGGTAYTIRFPEPAGKVRHVDE